MAFLKNTFGRARITRPALKETKFFEPVLQTQKIDAFSKITSDRKFYYVA
jgi:hypothetical protein